MIFICHIFCICSLRSLYLLFFSISFRVMFLYDRTVISISLRVEFARLMLQCRCDAALLCLEVYSVLANNSHPVIILSTVSSFCKHILHLLSTCWPHITEKKNWQQGGTLDKLWITLGDERSWDWRL